MKSLLFRSAANAVKLRQPSRLCTNGVKYGPTNPKIKELQDKFQLQNGLPVHLKGGVSDSLLYGFSLFLCVVGMGLYCNFTYRLGWPQKPKE